MAASALRGCMRAWIKDVRGTGIRINLLSLGAIDTPSLRSASAKAGGEDKLEAIIRSIVTGIRPAALAKPQ